jgi:anthranilate synthase/aminodeoxychorismate synthase-like glutamine amidotransferase
MILVIDNYDSFTYNLVQLVGSFQPDIDVIRNDQTTVAAIAARKPSGIIISPGPGRPENAGICPELIRQLGPTIPILGVCLGHQAIGLVYGGTITYAPCLMHGKTSEIHHHGATPFGGLSSPFPATRYHSLVISPEHFPADLEVTATTADGTIMAVRHRTHPIIGIEFHPESILTAVGGRIISNWLETLRERPDVKTQ